MEIWVIVVVALLATLVLYYLFRKKAAPAPTPTPLPAPQQEAAPSASAPPSAPGVAKQRKAIEVSDAELDQYLQDPNRASVVLFQSPGCGFCKAMLPAYGQYGQAAGNNVHVLMIDCARFSNIADRYKIEGFPTIKLFEKGQPTKEYEGDRKVGSFLTFYSGN